MTLIYSKTNISKGYSELISLIETNKQYENDQIKRNTIKKKINTESHEPRKNKIVLKYSG